MNYLRLYTDKDLKLISEMNWKKTCYVFAMHTSISQIPRATYFKYRKHTICIYLFVGLNEQAEIHKCIILIFSQLEFSFYIQAP